VGEANPILRVSLRKHITFCLELNVAMPGLMALITSTSGSAEVSSVSQIAISSSNAATMV
jgi:hypothetical protein